MRQDDLIGASRRLALSCARIQLHPPVQFTYNPLVYAREEHEEYIRRFASGRKRVVFLGMNPGPWGMAQTGVPFGEIATVREWMKIFGRVGRPEKEHPRVPVAGFACARSEVSGKRLWGLMRGRFANCREFFRHHFVANYCPLLFLDAEGRNLTPDKLCAEDRKAIETACDAHLLSVVSALEPAWVVGIGRFAEGRLENLRSAQGWEKIRVLGIPHPSPASPAANKDWAGKVSAILCEAGVW